MSEPTEQLCIPIVGTTLFLSVKDETYLKVKAKYGETHKIEAISGTKMNLKNLQFHESVCYGDGKLYHFKLTKLVTNS